MRFVRSGALALGLAGTLLLGSVAARAEHSDVDFPGIGTVTLRTIKAVGALPSVALAGPDGKVLLNATVGGTQSDYFRISKSADGTLNPTVHYAVLNGPDVTSKAVLAVAAATGGSDCAYEAIVFGSERGKLSLWTPKTIDTQAEGGIYVGDLGSHRGYGLAVWDFIWGDEPHVAPHRYKVWLYRLNREHMKFYPTETLTTKGHYADDAAALHELRLDFPNLTKAIPKLAC
ncbi:hypothetical protein [Acidisoma silvae]|uniref:Uncharacterized protein n=1 Tax=Acidisoma silvae TaxID=2802396 RepID=A0A963YNK0_9PROT|nr:hypothetical protein [Acidisoma silvae]MCB8874009.1 hypothetical protein [Acidisoma silvae]